MDKDKLNRYILLSLIAPIIFSIPAYEFLSQLTGHSLFFDTINQPSFLGIPWRIVGILFMIMAIIYVLSFINGLVAIVIDIWKNRTVKEKVILISILVIIITIIAIWIRPLAFFPILFIVHLISRNKFRPTDKTMQELKNNKRNTNLRWIVVAILVVLSIIVISLYIPIK